MSKSEMRLCRRTWIEYELRYGFTSLRIIKWNTRFNERAIYGLELKAYA
jgi:hypothetical protein